MDNFPEEKELNTGFNSPTLGLKEGEDIVFDETIDIEALQKNLQKSMDATNIFDKETVEEEIVEEVVFEDEEDVGVTEEDVESLFNKKSAVDDNLDEVSSEVIPIFENIQPDDTTSKSKKYVIYVEPENIDYVESLSVEERKNVINKILNEQNAYAKRQKEIDGQIRFFKHAMVVTVTVLIGFPTLFFLVNNSMIISMNNYHQAQRNFKSLYRDQGKVKEISPIDLND